LAKIHYENTPIKIKDLKLRFFEFANKHLYSKIAGSSPDSYRKQLIIEINKIKEHGDEFHKNTIKMINEFSDWQDAKVAYDDVKRFTYQNRKKLKNTKNIKLEPVRDILNNIEKQYSRFEDYVTLKRLKDRVTIPRPKKKGSEELSKPRGQYQRLLDKKYIISITDTKGETNYKLTDAGKEYLSALKESLTDKDGRMFFVSDIQSKLADAKELYNSVREELKEIHTEKQEFVDSVVKETSEWLNKSRKDVGEKQGIGGFFKRVAKFIRYGSIDNFDFLAREMDDLNPDGPFQKMSKELNEGWINELKFKHDGEDLFNDKIKKLINKKELAEYSKAFHYGIFSPIAKKINVKPIYFKVGKENIPLTKAQRIALYMYSKNDRALKHILDGGIGLTRNSPKIYKPTVEEFNNFIETATDKEKKLAGIISEYFDWQASKINEVSQKDIGLNLADEENYLPLEVRSDEIKSIKDIKDIKSIDDIKNYFKAGLPSVLKTRTESIAPIVINDAFVSMAKSASMVEKYVGMAIPIKKISAILNNIKSMMLKKGLIEEFDTLKTAVRNLENPNAAGDSGFIYKLDQIYIPAKLGYNIPVTLMQPFSIILYLTQKTGKPPIKISDVIKNFKRPKSIMELAKKYSPLIRERYSGMAQQDLFEHNYYSRARSLSGTTHNKIRKFFSVEGAMFPLTYMDGLNTSMMWQFAESEVRTNTNLKDGTEEFYKKVAERTEELIRNTQGLFSKLDKPNWLNIPVLRPLSYFMSQPIKQAQITIEGITKMRKGFRENKPNMVVGGLSDVIVASLINTLIVESIRLGYNTVVGKAEPEEWSDIVGWIKKIMASMLSNFSFPGQMVGEAFSEFKRSFGGPWGELHDSIISLMRDGISITENGEIDWDKTLTHLNKLEKNVIIGDKTAQDVIMLIKKQLGEE
jgi:DNA-binding PadR family transcriptional regulator